MVDDQRQVPEAAVPIAIVGMGALIPGATDLGGFWRTVVRGQDLITDVPADRWRVEDHYDPDPSAPDQTYAKRGAFLPEVDFDPLRYGVPPTSLPATDTSQLLALMVAEQVLRDAGADQLSEVERERTGVVLGTSATHPGLLTNMVAGRIANRFDLHGINHTTDAACASSLAAVSAAVAELALGRADLMIAGGVDTLNDIGTLCHSKTPALSPTGDCRPFAADADGTMLGEALAMVALKRLADAERDGDRVYAVIRGLGSSSDGRGSAVPKGQARALRRAYEDAGYRPETVELVEAHGSGTAAGDAAEFAALREVFTGTAGDFQRCALGTVKSQLGHTKSASGAVGLLKAALALHHKVLPPTIKVDQPNPALDLRTSPFYLNTAARPWVRSAEHPRRAAVSSFGFGGSNFHLTLEEYLPSVSPDWRIRTAPTELVLFSAASPEELLGKLDVDRPLAELARQSQQDFQPKDVARLAIVAADSADLRAQLEQAAMLIRQRPRAAFSTPGGSQYVCGAADPGRIGFLFPGQGAQYVGMGAGLAMQLPAAQRVWDRLGSVDLDDQPLHRVVFPPPAFSEPELEARQSILTATEWAQPALAVHSLVLLEVLKGLGLDPDCVAGHSFGELVALHCAGVYNDSELVWLARRRGELMRDAAAVPGAMLAVRASREQVEQVMEEAGVSAEEGLWLANHNGPRQTVLSGNRLAVESMERRLAAERFGVRRLAAATAFHSPLVAAAAEPLRDYLNGVEFRTPRLPVYGNADAAVYPTEPEHFGQRITDHLTSPVLFAELVEAMYADGVRTFVEVGAGSTMTTLVRQILGQRDHQAVCLDRKGRDGLTALHQGLGQLAVHGVELDFGVLWEHTEPASAETEPEPRMTVKINGANCGQPDPTPVPPSASDAESPMPPPPAWDEPAPRDALPAQDVSTVDENLLRIIEQTQQQTVAAHTEYQRMMTESHLAFLRMAEASLAALLGVDAPPAADAPPPSSTVDPRAASHPSQYLPPLPAPPPKGAIPVPRVEIPVKPPPAIEAAPVRLVGQDAAGFEELLLSVVAERTGYPVGMIKLEMDLDADLGIDSVKRAEILSAVSEQAGALSRETLAELGTLRTLREIIDRVVS